jgi:RHS repeat-associated protein
MLAEYVYLGDQLLSMIKPGENVYYFHNDHLGTPQVLTDDAQTIAWKAVYTAFGEAVPSIQTIENPFRFPGQYYDSETGLHYNYFRYYNPQTGRYITPDPIGLEGGINLFAYVENKPINNTDYLGLWRPQGHRDLTETALQKFPKHFNPNDIAAITAANVGVDYTNPFDDPAHYMPNTRKKAEEILNRFLELAIEMESRNLHNEAMYFLGAGLHTVQDRFAHYEQNAGWFEHPPLGKNCPDPDEPLIQKDPKVYRIEYIEATSASVDYINRYLSGIRKGQNRR